MALNRINDWVNRNWAQILMLVIGGIGAWFTLHAQITDIDMRKTDNLVFTRHVEHDDSLKTQILFTLEKIQAEQKRTHDFLCQNHHSEFGCQ